MNEELLYKYLVFIVTEVERYIQDRKVTDDQLMQFSIEIANFKEKVQQSNINVELKKRAAELIFNHTPKQIERNATIKIWMIFTFGWTARSYYRRQNTNRVIELEDLKSQANRMILYMKENY